MRIRYMSDLHLEFTHYFPEHLPSIGEDVVVLAGDIGVGTAGIIWARNVFVDRPVIYVLGNHEFYGEHFDTLLDDARTAARGSAVHVLEDQAVVIDGVRFLGSSFWTDFQCQGTDLQAQGMIHAHRFLNDYHRIRTGELGARQLLTPADTLARHKYSRAWLDQEIGVSTQPCVVVTHHGPSVSTCQPWYREDLLTTAFLNTADNLLRAPVQAWIFGHTHQTLTTAVNGIPLLTNQRGYPREGLPFSWDTVIEIQSDIRP